MDKSNYLSSRKARNSIRYLYLAIVSMFSIITLSDDVNVNQDEIYTDMEHVAMYIYEFDKLPSNYVHKSEYSLVTGEDLYLYGTFRNDERKLPVEETYTEAYINATKSDPGEERLVFATGVVYFTEDHYDSFDLITTGDIQASYRIWIATTTLIAGGTPAAVIVYAKKQGEISIDIFKEDTKQDIQYIKKFIGNQFEKVKDYVLRITE